MVLEAYYALPTSLCMHNWNKNALCQHNWEVRELVTSLWFVTVHVLMQTKLKAGDYAECGKSPSYDTKDL